MGFPASFHSSLVHQRTGWATGWPGITETIVLVQQNSYVFIQQQSDQESSLKTGKMFHFRRISIATLFCFA